MEERHSFVLYAEYEEAFSALPPVEQGALVMAIFSYVRTGEIVDLPSGAAMAFRFIRGSWIGTGRNTTKPGKNGQRPGEKEASKPKQIEQMLAKVSNAQQIKLAMRMEMVLYLIMILTMRLVLGMVSGVQAVHLARRGGSHPPLQR